jgi:hypothetical protein
MSSSASGLRGLTGASYAVGFLLIVVSVFDFATTILPAAPSDVSWRYGAVGLLSGFTLTPLLGGWIVAFTAASAGHRGVGVAMAALHLVVAVVIVLAVIGFGLDALQVRRATAEEQRALTELSSLKAVVKLLPSAAVAAWLGVAGLKTGRAGASPRSEGPASPVVVGR